MLFKAFNLNIKSDFDLKLPQAEGEADVIFERNKIANPKLLTTKVYRKSTTAKIAFDDKNIYLNWSEIADFQSVNSKNLYYQLLGDDLDVFRIFALSEALGLLLFQRGIFLLHGSAVEINNQAHVFVGVGGAGKSTTIAAFSKAGRTVLSDDLVAIQFIDGKPHVIPSFPHFKIWESSLDGLNFDKSNLEPAFEGHDKFFIRPDDKNFPDSPIPLKKITILQKPYSRKNKTIKSNEVPIELLKYFPLPHQLLKGQSLQKHFMDSIQIANQVEIERMNRPKDFKKLEEFVASFHS
jgi:hypothetical protein